MMQFAVADPTMPGPLHENVEPVAVAHIEVVVVVQVRLAPEPQTRLGVLISCVTTMIQFWVHPLEVLVAITV